MITELISVGTEILLGNIVNTNSAYLSEKCALLGLSVYYQDVVGDNEGRMRDVIRTALDRSDVVILTGGLGPTEDDITKEVTADLMGMPLKEDSHSRKLIDKYLKEYEKNNPQRRITKNNYKQAMVPDGAIVLDNHNGTAPGLILEKKGKTAILLPGPPNELKPMFEEYVVPYLQKNQPEIIVSQMVKISGIGESQVAEEIQDLIESQTNPTIAPYAKTGGTANAFFIFINRSGIDHAVAGGNSRSDCCFGLYVIGQLVYAKPQKRHFSVVVQKNSFFQNNSSLYVLLSMLLLL